MIYFITAREVGRVKIGHSCDPVMRFMKLRGDSPVVVALERVTEGDISTETALHRRFAGDCIHGEWYSLTPEIEALMGTLKAAPHVKSPGMGRRKKAFRPELRRAA